MVETVGALFAAGAAASGGTAAAAVAGSSLAAGGTLGVAAGAGSLLPTVGGIFTAGNLSLASTLLSGVSSVVGGYQQAQSYKAQAKIYADDAETARIAAASEEQARLKRLNAMLETNRAIAIASGYDPNSSGSFRAIQDDTEEQGLADVNTAKLNALSRAGRLRAQGQIYDTAATSSIIGGFAGAGSSLLRYATSEPGKKKLGIAE